MDITRKDIDTLKGLNWLNDEIINFYMQMIVERSKGGADSMEIFITFYNRGTLDQDPMLNVRTFSEISPGSCLYPVCNCVVCNCMIN